MTYEVTKDGITFTVRSETEALRLAKEGATVVALTQMVVKDGKLLTAEEAGKATGSGSGNNPPKDPLRTGTIE